MSTGLIDAGVIEARLEQIEARVEEHARWGGMEKEDVKLRAGLLLEEIRDAVRQGREQWVSIPRARELTGYHTQTLREYAARRLRGGEVPASWAGLEVRREGRRYEIRLATIPPRV